MKRFASIVATVLVAVVASGVGPAAEHAAAATPAFTGSETISRTNLDNGTDNVVDTRHFSVTVSDTRGLRDRQGVTVKWAGAHPTGALVTDHNSAAAAYEEYPVVLMQCRGVDSVSAPAAQQVSPKTCWTQTAEERLQSDGGFAWPSYRMDRYATTADRAADVNKPATYTADCVKDGMNQVFFTHWVPFVAADGTVYPGGIKGCQGQAPEQANSADSLQPGNTTYGVSDPSGNGQAKFVIQNADTNASLGCSATVACTLEIIPIMGVSCDAAGTASGAGLGMLPADRPDPTDTATFNEIVHGGSDNPNGCEDTGKFAPGEVNGSDIHAADLTVTGALWSNESNWRNRIAVPLTFAVSASVCNIVSNQAQIFLYGAEAMDQAMQQWVRTFCTNPKLFTVRHVQTSEPQAKNLLNLGNIDAALQGAPPTSSFAKPVVQAPAAVSGWAIAYSIDGADTQPYPNLSLNARLLAKLLSESYAGCAQCFDYHSRDAKQTGWVALEDNPIDMSRDPEFMALNPGIPLSNYLQAAASLAFMSSDSDVMFALTSYINSDPEARAWLNGTPDPWGMVVNPAYKGISLPVVNWPLLDTHLAKLAAGANPCLDSFPTPWLPLVAAPVLNPATVALNMQFDISNSQTACQPTGLKEISEGRQAGGSRFLLGLVSLGDAQRYQLPMAQLQTVSSVDPNNPFLDGKNRTFVAPTNASMTAAARLMQPDDALGTWTLPYDALHSTKSGAQAYPGTMLMSADVRTSGLAAGDAAHYAQFLRFVAGTGQSAGLGNGQLPPGYVPITQADGLGAFSAYTLKAADAVAAQNCAVLNPSGKAGSSGCGGPAAAPPVTTPPATHPSSAPSSAPTSAAAPTKSATTSPKPTISASNVAQTSKISTGPLSFTLPIAALLASMLLCWFAWRMGVGRR